MTGTWLAAALLGLALAPTHAPGQTCQLPLWVSVVDQHSVPVLGLSASDFALAQPKDGVVVSAIPSPPARVEILLDESASMGDSYLVDMWRIAEDNTSALFEALPPTVDVGLAGFNDHVTWIEDFRKPDAEFRNVLDATFRDTKPRGHTAFFDALAASVSRPGALHPGDVIFAVTDVVDTLSHTSLNEAARNLAQARVRLAILFLPELPGTSYKRDLPDVLAQQLAQKTGGIVAALQVRTTRTLQALLERAAWQVFAQQYRLTVAVPAVGRKSPQLKLQLAAYLHYATLHAPELAACTGSSQP